MRATPLLALALVGCFTPHGGGQIGEELAGCEAVGASALADDEVSGLGFAPADVLALAVPYDGPFRYADGGETVLHLSVAADGGAELVDYEFVDESGTGAEPAFGCADRVELPVRFAFATEDGAFDVEVPARLGAESAGFASLAARLADPGGTFDASAYAPDADAVDTDVFAAWDAAGASGTVSVQASRVDGEVASAELFDVGAWP